jgi:long-chain acyl-CoA synthetase
MMEENHIRLTFPGMFSETLRKFGKRAAYAFVGEEPRTYERVNHDILGLIAFQEKIGILPGDKVAILSLNMPNWATAYFSITFMGAVVVPILPDFSNTEVANVLEHSGAKAIFISNSLLSRIEGFRSEDLKTAILIFDLF